MSDTPPAGPKTFEEMSATITKAGQVIDWANRLEDGLNDMIEGGRLTEADIPDDFEWLKDHLAKRPK